MICIGHRGAKGHAPENTLRSIALAVELGAPWVEFDIHEAEEDLVLIHDENLERTTNGVGRVGAQSLAYLRGLDAGEGERIPLLREVLEQFAHRVRLNIEIKSPHVADLLFEQLRGYPRFCPQQIPRLLISSFHHPALREMRSLDPEIPIGLLTRKPNKLAIQTAHNLSAYSIHIPLAKANQRIIAQLQKEPFHLFVYTVNQPRDITRMKKWGVDGIFSDFPDRVLRHISPNSLTP